MNGIMSFSVLFVIALVVSLDHAAATETITTNTGGTPASAISGSMNTVGASSDGRFVVFSTDSTTLGPLAQASFDMLFFEQVFVKDRVLNAVYPVSVDVGTPLRGANAPATFASISDDGCFVSFQSSANNLVDQVLTYGITRVYVADRCTFAPDVEITVVDPAADGDAANPVISSLGTKVVFDSAATNLVAGDTNGNRDVFMYDVALQTISRLSFNTVGDELLGDAIKPHPSEDGARVVFQTPSTNVPTAGGNAAGLRTILMWETGMGTQLLNNADGHCRSAHISRNGLYATYACDASNLVPGITNGGVFSFVVYKLTIATGVHQAASLSLCDNDQNNLSTDYPKITNDGDRVVFQYNSRDLVSGLWQDPAVPFTNDFHILMRTFSTNITSLLSPRLNSRVYSNGDNLRPSISHNADVVVFISSASDLVVTDTNDANDVFLVNRIDMEFPPCFCTDIFPIVHPEYRNTTCTDDMLCAPTENSGQCASATMMDCMTCTVDGLCDGFESETCDDCNTNPCVPDGTCANDENWHNCPDDCTECLVDADCGMGMSSIPCAILTCVNKTCRVDTSSSSCSALFTGAPDCLISATCDITGMDPLADANGCIYNIDTGATCDDGFACSTGTCQSNGDCLTTSLDNMLCDDMISCTDNVCSAAPGTAPSGCEFPVNQTVCDNEIITDPCIDSLTCSPGSMGSNITTGCLPGFSPFGTSCDSNPSDCVVETCGTAGTCIQSLQDMVCEMNIPVGLDADCVDPVCVLTGGDANSCTYNFVSGACSTITCLANETCSMGMCQGGMPDNNTCEMLSMGMSPCIDGFCDPVNGDVMTGCLFLNNNGQDNNMCDDLAILPFVFEDQQCPDCDPICNDNGICEQNENSVVCIDGGSMDCTDCNLDNVCDPNESDDCSDMTTVDCMMDPCNATAADSCCSNRENTHNCWQDCSPCVDNGICEAFENSGCMDCLPASECMGPDGECNCYQGALLGEDLCCSENENPCICASTMAQSCSTLCVDDGMCSSQEQETCADCLSARCMPPNQNGICDADENGHNCPEDCQYGGNTCVCFNDGICDPGELDHCMDCNDDPCVPDGICANDENAHNCPDDCMDKNCTATVDCAVFDSPDNCFDLECVISGTQTVGFCRPTSFEPELTACNVLGALCTPGYCRLDGSCETTFNHTLCALEACYDGTCDPSAPGADPLTGCTQALDNGVSCYPTGPNAPSLCYGSATCVNGECTPGFPIDDTVCQTDPGDLCVSNGACTGGNSLYLQQVDAVSCDTVGVRDAAVFPHRQAVNLAAVNDYVIVQDSSFRMAVDDPPTQYVAMVVYSLTMDFPENQEFDHFIMRDMELVGNSCEDIVAGEDTSGNMWVVCAIQFSDFSWKLEFYLFDTMTSTFLFNSEILQASLPSDECGYPNRLVFQDDLLVMGVHSSCAHVYQPPNSATCQEATTFRRDVMTNSWSLATSFLRSTCTGMTVSPDTSDSDPQKVAVFDDKLTWTRSGLGSPPLLIFSNAEAFVFQLTALNNINFIQTLTDPSPRAVSPQVAFSAVSCANTDANTLAVFDATPTHSGNFINNPLFFTWNGTAFDTASSYEAYPVPPTSAIFGPDPLTQAVYPRVVSCDMSATELMVGHDTNDGINQYFVSFYHLSNAPANQFLHVSELDFFLVESASTDPNEGTDVAVDYAMSSNFGIVGAPSMADSDASGFYLVCLEAESGCVRGCTFDVAPDGTMCEDGIPCTENDQCSNGRCLGNGSNNMLCGAPTNQCSPLVCDTCYGCVTDILPDTQPCALDSYSCTVDICLNGTCVQDGTTGECDLLDEDCIDYQCDVSGASPSGVDPLTGCFPTPLTGNSCTVPVMECVSSGTCNAGTCDLTFDPAGTACDDGFMCTESSTCNAMGMCDNFVVNTTFCNGTISPALGQCIDTTCNPPAATIPGEEDGCVDTILTGMTCNDNVACTATDVCLSDATCEGMPDHGFCASFLPAGVSMDCVTAICDPDGMFGTPDANGCVYQFEGPTTVCDLGTCVTGAVCGAGGFCNILPSTILDDPACNALLPAVDDECKNTACDPFNAAADPATGCVATQLMAGTDCTSHYDQSCVGVANCTAMGICAFTSGDDMLCETLNSTPDNCIASACLPDMMGSDPITGCFNNLQTTGMIACDDMLACTAGEFCNATGVCQVDTFQDTVCETFPVFLASEGCLIPDCVGSSGDSNGCVYTNQTAGTSCVSDGYSCTVDECDALAVCNHTPDISVCQASPLNTVCVDPVCMGASGSGMPGFDPLTGCVFQPLTITVECDGIPCTVNDTCTTGVCNSGNNAVDNDLFCQSNTAGLAQCEQSQCLPALTSQADFQGCVTTPQPGPGIVPCDDGAACSTGDTCDGNGMCVGDTANSFCQDKSDLTAIDPVCRTGVCVTDGSGDVDGCVITDNTNPCDDGVPCTMPDTCSMGQCIGDNSTTTAMAFCASLSSDCVTAQCSTTDPGEMGTGCVLTNVTSGVCTSPFACVSNPMCVNGECVGDEDAAANTFCNNLPPALNNECVVGGCTVALSSDPTGCIYLLQDNTTSCTTEFDCTGTGQCDGAGGCEAVVFDNATCNALPPASVDQCIAGICDPPASNSSSGCRFENAIIACDDGISCTEDEMCNMDGNCVGAEVDMNCDSLIPSGPGLDPVCFTAMCDPNGDGMAPSGCVITNNTAPCNDNVMCTELDQCDGLGSCSNGVPVNSNCDSIVPPGQQCTRGICDPMNLSGLVIDPLVGCYLGDENAGTSCSDDFFCTFDDACTGSGMVCQGTISAFSNVTCESSGPALGNECVSGYCAGTPGSEPSGCIYQNNVNPCDDFVPCTINDVCSGGMCAGVPDDSICIPSNVCEQGVCDPNGVIGTPDADGCVYTPSNVGDPCDDGILCTENTMCNAMGECVGVNMDSVCDNLAPANQTICVAGLCLPGSGDPLTGCDFLPTNENVVCESDGYSCTNDTCVAGACVSTAIPNFCDSFFPANLDVVCGNISCVASPAETVPGTGCLAQAVADNTVCDDSIACTQDTRCFSGLCQLTDLSTSNQFCQDQLSPLEQPCQLSLCTGNTMFPNGCQYDLMIFDGAPCPDGLACTDNVCMGGVCQITEDDMACVSLVNDPCLVANCSAASPTANPVTGCEEMQLQPVNTSCVAAGFAPCVTEALCDISGNCVPFLNNTFCEAQVVAGTCQSAVCMPSNTSFADANGCVPVQRNDGDVCDDGYACTSGDSCLAGVCEGVIDTASQMFCAMQPEAMEVCIQGECMPSASLDNTGCIYDPEPFGTNCTGSVLCAPTGQCDMDGNCLFSVDPLVCESQVFDPDNCVVGVCMPGILGSDPVTGCANGTWTGACNDMKTCTTGDTCNNPLNECTGTPMDSLCPPSMIPGVDPQCVQQTCMPDDPLADPLTGCLPPTVSGGGCDDDVVCTESDTCSGGICSGTPNDMICLSAMSGSGMCLNATCDPSNTTMSVTNATLGCAFNTLGDGSNCDDGIACTINDICVAGMGCVGTPVDGMCTAAPTCTVGRCSTDLNEIINAGSLDGCIYDPEPDNTPCDDMVNCTPSSSCQMGTCTGVYNSTADDFCNALVPVPGQCVQSVCEGPSGDVNGCGDCNCASEPSCPPMPLLPNCPSDCVVNMDDDDGCLPGQMADACGVCDGNGSCSQVGGMCIERATQAITQLSEAQMWLSMCASRQPLGTVCLSGINTTPIDLFWTGTVPVASLPLASRPATLPLLDCMTGANVERSCVREYVQKILIRHSTAISCQKARDGARDAGVEQQFNHLCECVASCALDVVSPPECEAASPFHQSGCTLGPNSVLSDTSQVENIRCDTFQNILDELEYARLLTVSMTSGCSASFSDVAEIRRYPGCAPKATLAYEDTLGDEFDFDYNDFVAIYDIVEAFDSNGNLLAITVDLKPVARGSMFDHILLLSLDGNRVPGSNLQYQGDRVVQGSYTASVQRFNTDGSFDGHQDTVGPSLDEDLLVISSTMKAMMNPSVTTWTDYFVNTPKFTPFRNANSLYSIFIQACSPSQNNLASRTLPGVPNYYFTLKSVGRSEVTPFVLVGANVLNAADTIDAAGHPYAVNLPDALHWPVELRRIDIVYPLFEELRQFLLNPVLPAAHNVTMWHHFILPSLAGEVIDPQDVPSF